MKLWQTIKLMSIESTLDIIESKITEFEAAQINLEQSDNHIIRNSLLILKFERKLDKLVEEKAKEPYTFSKELAELTQPLIEKADYKLFEEAIDILKYEKEKLQSEFDIMKESQQLYEKIYFRNKNSSEEKENN